MLQLSRSSVVPGIRLVPDVVLDSPRSTAGRRVVSGVGNSGFKQNCNARSALTYPRNAIAEAQCGYPVDDEVPACSMEPSAFNVVIAMGRPTQKLALLVIDTQNHFRDAIGTEPSLVQKLDDLAAFLRTRGVPIVYTQHGTPDPAAEEGTDVLVAFWGAAESIKCVAPARSCSSYGVSREIVSATPPNVTFATSSLEACCRCRACHKYIMCTAISRCNRRAGAAARHGS